MKPIDRDKWRPLVWLHVRGKYRQRLTTRFAESLLNEKCADRIDHYDYARPLARWLRCNPEFFEKLKPAKGRFHQKILDHLLASPLLTPELRKQLAEIPEICAHML